MGMPDHGSPMMISALTVARAIHARFGSNKDAVETAAYNELLKMFDLSCPWEYYHYNMAVCISNMFQLPFQDVREVINTINL